MLLTNQKPSWDHMTSPRWRCPSTEKLTMSENYPPDSSEYWNRSHGFSRITSGSCKNVLQLQNRYLQCRVILNDKGPFGKRSCWRLRELGSRLAYIGCCKALWGDDLIGIQSENRWHEPPTHACALTKNAKKHAKTPFVSTLFWLVTVNTFQKYWKLIIYTT